MGIKEPYLSTPWGYKRQRDNKADDKADLTFYLLIDTLSPEAAKRYLELCKTI